MIPFENYRNAKTKLSQKSDDYQARAEVIRYHLEQRNLGDACTELSKLKADHLSIDAFQKIFELASIAFKKEYGCVQTYHYRAPRTEHLSAFIGLLEMLRDQKSLVATDWLSPAKDNYKLLRYWIDRDHQAMYQLGRLHYYGGGDLPKNLDAALECFLKSEEARGRHYADTDLLNLIGCVYDRQKKGAEALEYFKRASDKGCEVATYNVGLCHKNGDAGTKDLVAAKRAFESALEKGYKKAADRLGDMCLDKNDEVGAKHYFSLSGTVGAFEYALGCKRESGKKYDQAFKLLHQAMKLGNPAAKTKLTGKTQVRVSSYYSLFDQLEEEGDTFDQVWDGMQPYLTLQERLGYYFINAKYLLDALDREIQENPKEAPFQKLEFLGDSLLTAVVREYMVDKTGSKKWTVGDMEHASKPLLANDGALKAIAQDLSLAALIELDPSEKGRAITPKMQADALEAIIGAVYQDYGFSKCSDSTKCHWKSREVIHHLWKPHFEKALQSTPRSQSQQATSSANHVAAALNSASASSNAPSSAPVTLAHGSLTPRTQRAFTAISQNKSKMGEFKRAIDGMPDVNRRNIGKEGNTVLGTLCRKNPLRSDNEVPKIKYLISKGASWSAKNNQGKSAEDIFRDKHPDMCAQFGR